ncbi:hypothetical protein ABPG75_003004 [Micractinium tetrahymenae]
MVLGLIFKLIPTYGNLTRLLAFAVGMVFPTLESMRAIESKQLDDDTQWLMYWVCYATLLSLEQVAWAFLIWIPFYRLLRVAALAWLALPQTRGAAMLYVDLVRPFLLGAMKKATELPALEPYASQFLPHKEQDAAKREASKKAGEVQLPASLEEEEAPSMYQPLKAHAQ